MALSRAHGTYTKDSFRKIHYKAIYNIQKQKGLSTIQVQLIILYPHLSETQKR